VLAEDRGEEVAVDELAVSSMKKHRSASPSQAMPRSAPVSRTLSMISVRLCSSSGLGSPSGISPSGSQRSLTSSTGQAVEQRADHRAAHAVAAVDDDLQRLDVRRVDELSAASWNSA
jgi:hypothetical protein